MNNKQRLTHALLFEFFALIIVVPLATFFAQKEAGDMLVVAVGLSIYAVVWNYFYNIIFDRYFGEQRASRTLATRLIHTAGFELGIIVVTLPAVAWFLGISMLSALMLEAAFLVFFFFYAMIFNGIYDRITAPNTAATAKIATVSHKSGH
ncbi:PACE efflux transporter [Shewanella waksmanii]|uniref:PACE efflux transporter n=1 Tax=Shewanella waksmanii TaxID=213783 RepID=UPI0004B93CC8|nr:PACE efflux transporter [Shewanella waksmanii]